jgi:hypothetical protein
MITAFMPPYHWLRHDRRAQKTIDIALAKNWETPWRWFLREPKHVGVFTVTILILFRVDAASDVHWLDFNKGILLFELISTIWIQWQEK